MASAMAITLASAKNLTRRKRWPRVRTNEGHVRVLVPLDYLENGKSADGPHASPHESLVEGLTRAPGTVEAIAALERHVARLEAALEASETALDEARSACEEAREKALVEALSKASLTATLEAVRSERDRLLTLQHLREQRRW